MKRVGVTVALLGLVVFVAGELSSHMPDRGEAARPHEPRVAPVAPWRLPPAPPDVLHLRPDQHGWVPHGPHHPDGHHPDAVDRDWGSDAAWMGCERDGAVHLRDPFAPR